MKVTEFLEAIKCKKEIGVVAKDGYSIYSYNVVFADTFDNDLVKEARGIIISADGEIIRRPFEKFFNLYERPETKYDVLKDVSIAYVMEKVDGAMISPFYDNTGKIVWGTKRVAENFHKFIEQRVRENYVRFVDVMLQNGYTPIFEYYHPDLKESNIVLRYNKEVFKLLAVRHIEKGYYLRLNTLALYADKFDLELPKVYQYLHTLDDCIEYVKGREHEEGLVIVFSNGQRVKLKTDWYVKRHKIKDQINMKHNMAKLILGIDDLSLDDLMPYIDEEDRQRIDSFSIDLEQCMKNVVRFVEQKVQQYKDEKDYALNEKDKRFSHIVFGAVKGKDIFDMVKQDVEKAARKGIRFDEWFEIARAV